MGSFQFAVRKNLGTYLFGLWLVLLGFLSWPQINMIQHHWVNIALGILLIVAGVCHLIEF
jgi:hypothetical protein